MSFNVSNDTNGTDVGGTENMYEYVFIFTLGLMGVILNSLVLFIAFRYVDLTSKLCQVFVVTMTFSDLGYAIFYCLTRPWLLSFPTQICGAYYICIWFCQISSALSLLLLNVEKFISICWPLRYHSFVTQCRVTGTVVTLAPIILSVLIFSYYGPFLATADHCVRVTFDPAWYYLALVLLFHTTPVVISFMVSVYVFTIAQLAANRAPTSSLGWKSSSRRGDTSIGHRHSLAPAHHHGIGSTKALIRPIRRVFFVFSSTMWTSMTSLPYRFAYVYYTVCMEQQKESGEKQKDGGYGTSDDACVNQHQRELITWLMRLVLLGPLGNPFITIITQRAYRRRAAQLLNRFLKWISCGRFPCWKRQEFVVAETETVYLRGVGSSSAKSSAGEQRATANSGLCKPFDVI